MTLDPTIEDAGLAGRPTIRIEREFAQPIDRVWCAVSEPGELDRWFVDSMGWTPRLGETLDVGGQAVRVTRLQEPSVIAWEWGDERYRIELEPTNHGTTRFVFRHAFVEAIGSGRQHALGWQVYVGRLATHLNGHFVEELDAHTQALAHVHHGRPAVRFIRRFELPTEGVWDLIATPAGLSSWFPCSVSFDELHEGAAMAFDFGVGGALQGTITEFEAGRGLAFDWGDDWIALDLLEVENGAATLLTFTHLLSDGEDAISRTAAGWHVCLDSLVHRAADPAAPPVRAGRTPEWEARYDAYVARGYPSGAPIPAG